MHHWGNLNEMDAWNRVEVPQIKLQLYCACEDDENILN